MSPTIEAPRLGRPKGSKNKVKAAIQRSIKASVAHIPIRTRVALEEVDEECGELQSIPMNGMCSCGSRPYSWDSKRAPTIGFFCPSAAHGGNGKFWAWPASEPAARTRTRRSKNASVIVEQ